jgi:hypothetical protein
MELRNDLLDDTELLLISLKWGPVIIEPCPSVGYP